MSYFKTMMLAGAVAVSGVFGATNADALIVSGTFEITAYNYNPAGSSGSLGGDRSNNSQATAANFNAISTGTPNIGTLNANANTPGWDQFTYTGALKFRIPNGRTTTTIKDFLDTGGGVISGLDPFFGALINSAGDGGGDNGNTTGFLTTTIYKITATSFSNISSLSQLTFVKHDDGITIQGSNGTSVASIGPNSEKTTNTPGLTGSAGNFVLYYASANGDPSVLEVNAIPLPAAAWLLFGVAGALVATKRRSALRAA